MGSWLAERFGVTVPLVGAPMAGAAGGALAGAISSAGGLGMVGCGSTVPVDWVLEQRALAAAAGRPYGVGLLAWSLPDRPELIDAVLDDSVRRPALVSVSYGEYAQHVPVLQDAGVAVATQAGTVADAVAAVDAGVDVVVARGGEGGGHGRNQVATLPLLDAVLEAVDVPVLAAGGISGPRGVAAVLAAGAAGAWVGTAFLTCRESLWADDMVSRLAETDETGTAYGTVFDTASAVGWPSEFGGRAVRNEFFTSWQGREAELASDAEANAAFRAAATSRDLSAMALYAGQGVGRLGAGRPAAADVVADLARAGDLLRAAVTRLGS
ncbi:MAG: nitronate monooxygenase [Nocardioidaceae bacterium]